jgi:hypothetical protein
MMLRKFHVGMALAVVIAAEPFALSRHGIERQHGVLHSPARGHEDFSHGYGDPGLP